MEKIYKLQISFLPNSETFNSLNSIFGKEILNVDESPSEWIYEVVEKENDEYFDFINSFLDILDSKYSELEKLNIKRQDITIWMLYEYNQQCNLEFDPVRLKRIGDNEITLCISCWEK